MGACRAWKATATSMSSMAMRRRSPRTAARVRDDSLALAAPALLAAGLVRVAGARLVVSHLDARGEHRLARGGGVRLEPGADSLCLGRPAAGPAGPPVGHAATGRWG